MMARMMDLDDIRKSHSRVGWREQIEQQLVKIESLAFDNLSLLERIAELEEKLSIFADESNWEVYNAGEDDFPTAGYEWSNPDESPIDIARRALAGEGEST